jgi:formylmethanofuran dehydrogenase subunit E
MSNSDTDYTLYRSLPINWALKHKNERYRIQPCVECGEQFVREKKKWMQIRCKAHFKGLPRGFAIKDDSE